MYDEVSPHVDPAVFDLGIPILGICYGLQVGDLMLKHFILTHTQEIAWNLNGEVTKCDHREYGFAKVQINKLGDGSSVDALFEGLGDEMQVCYVVSSPHSRSMTNCARSGCPMEISYQSLLQIFMSSGTQTRRLMPHWHTIPSLCMEYNSIRR